jgi:glucose-6-phosphate 1-epimerase
MPRVEVASPLASGEIYLQGAHVTAYAPRGGAPVLFLSRQSRFERAAPIRGGIPLAFPWFGRRAGEPDAPLHGLARVVPWNLDAATVDPAGVVDLTFGLASLADPRWPAGAVLRYRVALGRELALALEVENRGPTPIVFEEVLHTYLAVADVAQISIAGLEGAAYLDEADGFARKRQGPAPLVVRGETDRVYDDTDAPCVVWDPVGRRRVEVATAGSETTVVWNPGAARALPDLGADEWPRFVCVESGNVGARVVTLAARARHRLTVDIRSEPWSGA